MPELISKYPDVTLQILREAGAHCGEGVEQKILTKCPPAQFCALPTGELCIYGMDAIPRMTQITPRELASSLSRHERWPWQDWLDLSIAEVILLAATFAVGLLVGRFWSGRRRGEGGGRNGNVEAR